MKLFFSGVAGPEEFELLQAAGVKKILVTPFDLHNIPTDWDGELWLDSTAYPEFKNPRMAMDLDHFLRLAESRPFVHINAPDVIGDPTLSLLRWRLLKRLNLPLPFVPVWQWGSPERFLWEMLDDAPVVAIGGCVPWLKVVTKGQDKEVINQAKAQREANFKLLQQLCVVSAEKHGRKRLHILGNCWEKSLEELIPLLYSSDTSHWLTPRRSGCCVFRHSKSGRLSKAPARALPNAKGWTLDERCIESAKSMAAFFHNPSGIPMPV